MPMCAMCGGFGPEAGQAFSVPLQADETRWIADTAGQQMARDDALCDAWILDHFFACVTFGSLVAAYSFVAVLSNNFDLRGGTSFSEVEND
ncbi:hypothetical protein WAI453_012172 [Rhynchosporium graminicola]